MIENINIRDAIRVSRPVHSLHKLISDQHRRDFYQSLDVKGLIII